MRRKQFKRNIQQQRQRRSVVITVEKNLKQNNRRMLLENIAGGLFMGIFLTFIISIGFGIIRFSEIKLF